MPNRSAPAPATSTATALSSTSSRRSDSDAALPPSESTESRRLPPREERFIIQYGSRLHSYGRDKAPYPVSYNREDLQLALLDHHLVLSTKNGSNTFIDFAPGEHPRRCLDIACGMGTWVIEAAREWPDCTFVGFDLMNVQIPLWVLEDGVAARIEWVHGNLLRKRLPFEDEEFDYVHIDGLAFAVPENKWISVYEELRRVMRTGGIIEQVEEDAIFPILPRWFTEPLHAHVGGPGANYQGPGGSPRFPPPSPTLERHNSDEDDREKSHEHAFLESLFNDVFENRFINRVPSSCLPNYFTAIFGQAMIPPVLQFPMPPLAPMAPLPAELEGQAHVSARRRPHEQDELQRSVDSLLSTAQSETNVSASVPTTSSRTLDSIVSTEPTTHSARSSLDAPPSDRLGASLSSFDTSRSSPAPDNKSARKTTLRSQSPSIKSTRSTEGSNGSRPSLRSRDSGPHRDSYSLAHSNKERPSVPSGDLRTEDSTSLGGTHLFPMETILSLPERSLNMQLFRALGLVMSVKEAMWDELCERVGKAAEERRLREECGWEDADFAESALREKFEGWVERYRSDVRARVSLWYSMVLSGWQYPRRDPISRAEMLEEERLRQDILEARKHAKGEDLMGHSRSIRLLVGTKVRMDSVS